MVSTAATVTLPHGGGHGPDDPLAEIAALDRYFNSIYDGPSESPPWRSALHLLLDTLQAKHVTLILRPPTSESEGVMVNTDTVAADATESYKTRFFALDPFVGIPENEVLTPLDLVGERWTQTALYREYLRPLDVEHLVGADIHTADGIECRFRVARARDMPAFSASDKALCRLLLPHLRRSIQLHARLDGLECERQLFAGVVESMQLGVLSYARDGTLIESNEEARRILDARDGIRLSGSMLCFERRSEGREFRRMLRDALADAPPSTPALVDAMSVARPSGRSPLGLVVRRIQAAPWPYTQRRPAGVVYLRDPEGTAPRVSLDVVQRLFGLTRMEAGLALALADGLSLEEAAEHLGIRKNTARTYLRFIFCKTGVTRQTLLIRKLLNSVVSIA